MSLLGPHVPVVGWTSTAATRMPDEDMAASVDLARVAIALLGRSKGLHELGQRASRARDYFDARVFEGRHEAAEVRRALGLPMSAELPDVLAAIRARS